MSDETTLEKYEVACFSCKNVFDAVQSNWCKCLTSERTLICPNCEKCFCKSGSLYKEKFWISAPQMLWDRKLEEHKSDFKPKNPDPDDVTHPLVLVVDDEKEILKIASYDLEGLGYCVILARDGMEGMELAKKYRPDLIISDALMPRLDGREMCRRIKADPEIGNIKVVIMTSLYTQSKYKTEAFRAFRVDDYIPKPLDFEQLRTILQKYLPDNLNP